MLPYAPPKGPYPPQPLVPVETGGWVIIDPTDAPVGVAVIWGWAITLETATVAAAAMIEVFILIGSGIDGDGG